MPTMMLELLDTLYISWKIPENNKLAYGSSLSSTYYTIIIIIITTS